MYCNRSRRTRNTKSMKSSKAAVWTGPGAFEVREFPVPEVGDDDGLLRVEACGLCGTDLAQAQGSFAGGESRPMILGHEILGIVEALGPAASRRWNLKVGDRVSVEPILGGCGRCDNCRLGQPLRCTEGSLPSPRIYSRLPLTVAPALWGGYSEYLYLHPNAVVHRMGTQVAAETAVLFNPLANAIEWSILTPRPAPDASVLILGPGQRGLACVVALRAATASAQILVTGLSRDTHKLKLARELGADEVIDVERTPLLDAVKEATKGRGADLVIDTTDAAPGVVAEAVAAVRVGGTIVLAGHKGGRPSEVAADDIIAKRATIIGSQSASWRAFELAASFIDAETTKIDRLHTHSYGLHEVGKAIDVLAGRVVDGPPAIAVCVRPQGIS